MKNDAQPPYIGQPFWLILQVAQNILTTEHEQSAGSLLSSSDDFSPQFLFQDLNTHKQCESFK
jgi:hypothetical protein